LYVVIHKDCNTSFYHRAAATELSPAGGGGNGSGGDEGRWWFCVAAVAEAWPLCYSIAAAESVENQMDTSPGCGGGRECFDTRVRSRLTLFAPFSTARFPATVA